MIKYYTSEDAGSGQYGICAKCKKGPTDDGHDGCLGTLAGDIMNACCGHGNDRQAYVQFSQLASCSGNAAIVWIKIYGKDSQN